MRYIDYSNLNAVEVVRRLRQIRGKNVIPGPSDVVPLLLRYAPAIPLYKTSHTDPIDAVVELLCKIIPTSHIAYLKRGIRAGDYNCAYDLSVCYAFGLNGLLSHDCSKTRQLTIDSQYATTYNPTSMASQLYGCHCSLPVNMERFTSAIDFTDEYDGGGDGVIMRTILEDLCAHDVVCPIVLMLAAASSKWSISPSSNNSISEYLVRHPVAYRYLCDFSSMKCNNVNCDIGYCEPGISFRCERCGIPYCSVSCREHSRSRHQHDLCKPILSRVYSSVFPQKNALHPKPYLEHLLGMFGIVLPPRNQPDMLHSLKCNPNGSIFELVESSISDMSRGYNVCAANTAFAARSIIDGNGKFQINWVYGSAVYAHAKALTAIGNYGRAITACNRILNSDLDSIVGGKILHQVQEMQRTASYGDNEHEIRRLPIEPSYYETIDINEVSRRLQIKRGDVGTLTPICVLELLLNASTTLSLYKTSLSDYIDAIVELLDNVIPVGPIESLKSRADSGDSGAKFDLFICYTFGLLGVDSDSSRAGEYYSNALMEFNGKAVLEGLEQCRAVASDGESLDYFTMLEIPTAEQFQRNWEAIWTYLDIMCKYDRTCAAIYMLAMEARTNHPDKCKKSVRLYLENHPEAVEFYNKAVCLPCCNLMCESGHCEPGIIYRCERCSKPYCSVYCRDVEHECAPSQLLHVKYLIQEHPRTYLEHPRTYLEHPRTYLEHPRTYQEHPRTYLEHVLSLFDIQVPLRTLPKTAPKPVGGVIRNRPTVKPTNDSFYDQLLSCAKSLTDRGYQRRACRILTITINELLHQDPKSPTLTQLILWRARAFYAAKHIDAALSDCEALISGLYDITGLLPSELTEIYGLLAINERSTDRQHNALLDALRFQTTTSETESNDIVQRKRKNKTPKPKPESSSSSSVRPKSVHEYSIVAWSEIDNDTYDACPVCYREPEEFEDCNIIMFKCKHIMCPKCLIRMVKTGLSRSEPVTCPMCRAELPNTLMPMVAKQHLFEDHQEPDLEYLASTLYIHKPRDALLRLYVNNKFNATSVHRALFMMMRMTSSISPTSIDKIRDICARYDTLLFQFDAVMDTTVDSFQSLRDSLTSTGTLLRDTILRTIRDMNVQPVIGNGPLHLNFTAIAVNEAVYAFIYVINPVLKMHGRVVIHDIGTAHIMELSDSIPAKIRSETHDGVLTLTFNE